MRIGVCQLEIEWECKEKSMEKVLFYLRKAKEEKADIVFFPEMSLTGFSMEVKKTRDSYFGETIGQFQKICKEMELAVGFGWVEQEGEKKAHNHYSVVDKQGNILSDYVKIHPFGYGGEAEFFEGGNLLKEFQYGEHRFSTAICYDLRFPELFRIMDENCSIVIVPANWPASRKEHWQCLLQARAIENQMYVVGINCVGMMNNCYYSGDSSVFNPLGKTLAEIHDEEGLLVVDILNDVETYREQFPVRRDQRIKVEHIIRDGGII